jgi:hypothetical protein
LCGDHSGWRRAYAHVTRAPLNATKAEIVPRAAFVRGSLYSPGLLVEVRAAKRTKTNRRWGKGTESGDYESSRSLE